MVSLGENLFCCAAAPAGLFTYCGSPSLRGRDARVARSPMNGRAGPRLRARLRTPGCGSAAAARAVAAMDEVVRNIDVPTERVDWRRCNRAR